MTIWYSYIWVVIIPNLETINIIEGYKNKNKISKNHISKKGI